MTRTKERARWLPVCLAGGVLLTYVAWALVIDRPGSPQHVGHPVLANWDGEWYRDIAEHGYRGLGGTTNPEFRPEFFPLFPGLAAGLHALLPFVSLLTVGVMLNIALVLAAVGLVDRVASASEWPMVHRCLMAVFLVTVPNAFFFVCFFGEAALAFCVALVIWGIKTPNRLVWAAVGAAVGTLARPVGVLLAIPIGLTLLYRRRLDREAVVSVVVAGSGVPILFATYKVLAGSPIAFMHAQFGNPEWREGVLGRYGLRGFWDQVHQAFFGIGFEDFGSQPIGLIMVVVVVVFGVLAWRWNRPMSIGALVFALGPLWFQAITALARYLVPSWFAWVGGVDTLRRRRTGVAAVVALILFGYACNIQLLDRFIRWQFVG